MAAFTKFRFFRHLAKKVTKNIISFSSSKAGPGVDGKLVDVEKRGSTLLIGIDRPDKRNCVNLSTAQQLKEAFNYFEEDDNIRVAVLHGKGGYFCSGFDLKELSQWKPNMEIPYSPMGPSKMWLSKPLIAAISGYAVAGGLELALMGDMRIVEESAIMGVFCRRFGVPLIDGGTVRLPKLIGLSRAMDLILIGRPIVSSEAMEYGLANRIVNDGTALEESIKIAEGIAAFPYECMKRDRMSAYCSAYEGKSFEDSMHFEHANAAFLIEQESVKGARSFVSGIGKKGSFDDEI